MILPEVIGNKFMYFGYGSNLLLKRIQINNRTLARKDIGILKDHRLDFYLDSKRWNGSSATIVPTPGSTVWGAIWEIALKDLKDLDEQEGVDAGIYIPLSYPIVTPSGKEIICRTYQMKNLPGPYPTKGEPIPSNRQPSLTYLKTITKGAIESSLPKDYIDFIKSFKNNENIVEHFEIELDLKDFHLNI